MAKKCINQKWLLFVAYFFFQMNIWNQSLHGPNTTLIEVAKKLIAFQEKLKLWKRKTESQKAALFSLFNQFLKDMEETCINDAQLDIKRQKIWNGCAMHLLLILILCQKAVKVFFDFKGNSVRHFTEKETFGQFWTKIKNEKVLLVRTQ